MNIKNGKGVTLLTLIITIVVMIIIASIAIYSGSQVIKDAQKEDVKTNMLLIQAEMKNYVEQAKFEGKDTIDGVTVNNVTLHIQSADDAVNGAGNEVKNYYRILNDMSDFNLGNLNKPELYLIAFDINKVEVYVYFLNGIEDSNGSIYYELSEMID